MALITFKTSGVCSKEIKIQIEDEVITKVTFKAGCDGNLEAVSKLVEGMRVDDVIKRLKGINCDGKGTSCPDQLARALEDIMKKNREGIA